MNIIFNAVDAMPDGGILTINAQARDGEIPIQFKDVGIGMTEETIERIFDPFFSTKGVKGTGLGMSEVLNVEIFDTLLEAKVLISRWRNEYNHIRPHSSLGYKPPAPETQLLKSAMNNQIKQLRINS